MLKDLIVHKVAEHDDAVHCSIEEELIIPTLDVNFEFSGAIVVYVTLSGVEAEISAWEPEPSRLLGIKKNGRDRLNSDESPHHHEELKSSINEPFMKDNSNRHSSSVVSATNFFGKDSTSPHRNKKNTDITRTIYLTHYMNVVVPLPWDK